MNRKFYIIIFITTILTGCTEEETFNIQPKTDWSKEQSIDMNTVLPKVHKILLYYFIISSITISLGKCVASDKPLKCL